jgi:hypothetical protein
VGYAYVTQTALSIPRTATATASPSPALSRVAAGPPTSLPPTLRQPAPRPSSPPSRYRQSAPSVPRARWNTAPETVSTAVAGFAVRVPPNEVQPRVGKGAALAVVVVMQTMSNGVTRRADNCERRIRIQLRTGTVPSLPDCSDLIRGARFADPGFACPRPRACGTAVVSRWSDNFGPTFHCR